jgi:hypothetical protein
MALIETPGCQAALREKREGLQGAAVSCYSEAMHDASRNDG